VEVGDVERQVVVAAVPQHDVRLGLGLAQDGPVVDPGVDDDPGVDVRLVLLAFLDGAVVPHEVRVGLEALAGLRSEVAVRHRVADRHDTQPHRLQQRGHVAGGLALAHPGAHGGHGDDRATRAQRRAAGARHDEVGTCGDHARGEVHDLGVRQVGVGEDHGVHPLTRDERLQTGLVDDRDAVRIVRPGERGRVGAAVDVGNLRRGERDDLGVGVVAVQDVEVVEVASRSTQDEDAFARIRRGRGAHGVLRHGWVDRGVRDPPVPTLLPCGGGGLRT